MNEYVIVRKGMIFAGWRDSQSLWLFKLSGRVYNMGPAIYNLAEARDNLKFLAEHNVEGCTIHEVLIQEDPFE